MNDLGKVWGSLSSVQKSKIGFDVAGVRQLNVVNSLMGSWNKYTDIIDNVDKRTGMAAKNQEVYANSVKGKLGELAAIGQSTWNNLLNSDVLKGGIGTLGVLANTLDKVSSSLGGLGAVGTIGAGVGIFAFLKNLD
jgi:hypothetical protein